MAFAHKSRDSHSHEYRQVKKQESKEDYGGLTQNEVDALEEIDSGKVEIIRCKNSDDFFKKLGIED